MNIPLVRNDLVTNFRSASPPTNRTTNKIARERSPPQQNYFSRHDSVPRNQVINAPVQNTAQKAGPGESDAFRVYVRLRPLNSKEISNNTTRKGSTVEARDDMVFVFDPENPSEVTKKEKVFVFDNVFGDTKSTEEIYQETLTPALENMVQGFNSTIFAYGMTGAGKTYTMFGDIYNSHGGMQFNPGLVNLMVRDIFQTFSNESSNYEFFMKMSYIEIYNEQIRDLLNPSAENLMVVEDPEKGVMISNISEYSIQSEHELLKHIFAGNSKRIMATTHANQFSSRSHAIIQLTVEKRSRVRDIQETYTQSKLCFVDLAGSERAATTENRGIRMQEGANINRSLLALGNCINILSDANKKGAFVPYRDSKLTRLLKDSLGGNTRTIMLACISPASIAYEETVNTLNYASRARKIKKKVMSNIKEVELHVSQYKEIIESLRNEIGSLKHQLEHKGGDQIQVVKRPEILDSAAGSMNQVDDGSLDALGKQLFANLEENWEISQSLKELRDLKKQNEEAIIAKMEEQQGIEDEELIQAIAKEIESLSEVMSNNEKIEQEMEANLERNLKEKKQIEEKMLAASSQYASTGNTNKYYESLDRSFQHISGEKDVIVEKDNKILQLEQEINKMRRELAEKDKLIAQNQQPQPQSQLQAMTRNSPLQQTSSQTHRVSKTPSSTSRAYQPPSTSQANKNQQQPSHSYGFGQNRDYLRELKSKKAEKHGSMTDVSERPSAYKQQEETRLSKDMNAEEMMEIINNRNLQDRYSTVLMKEFSDLTMQRDEKKRGSRFFKGSGLNESSTKTAANTIRQMVKNKYNQATQPVSVEELKNYAEKLKGVNFEAVQKKSKKPPKAYASPQLNPQPTPISSYYAHLTQQQGQGQGQRVASNDAHKSSKGNFIGKSGVPPGTSQYNQIVGNKSDKKGSRDGTPEKGFSEISSIVVLPGDQSPDQSVDEYILAQATEEDKEKRKYSTVDPRSTADHQQIQPIASPNFHLNIRYLMSNEASQGGQSQPQHHHHHTHSTNPVVSTSKSHERGLTSLLPKGQSQGKITKMLPSGADPDYLLAPQVHLSADKRTSEPTMRGTASSHKSKESPQKDDPPRPNTLYYLNFRRDEAKRSLSREKITAHSVKSQTLDQEGSMSPSIHSQSLTKHIRSTSLHNKQFGALKRQAAANAIAASMEDSNSIQNSTQRLQESSEGPKKGTNEIRTLEEARDLVRNFRVKLTSLAYVVDKNFVDEKYSQEISNLIKEYNENKYILSTKDQVLLSKVEAAILKTERNDSNEGQKGSTEQAYKSTRSVSVNPKVATKYVTTSIKDLETRQDDSPYQIYKKSADLNGFNDSTSSERGSNHEEKTTNANSSAGQTKESSLLYSKNKGGLVYSSGRNSNNNTASGNAINIYNQFAMQDIRPFQTNRDVYLSPKTQPEGEVMHSRKEMSSEYGSSRGKANPEVQILIEKQKKNLEELEKKKGLVGSKNFDLGFVDVYHTSRPSYQEPARTEITERGTERGSNRKSINMNQFE